MYWPKSVFLTCLLILLSSNIVHAQSGEETAADPSGSDDVKTYGEIYRLLEDAEKLNAGSKALEETLNRAFRLSEAMEAKGHPRLDLFLTRVEQNVLGTPNEGSNVTDVSRWIVNRIKLRDFETILDLSIGTLQIVESAYETKRYRNGKIALFHEYDARNHQGYALLSLGRVEEAELVYAERVKRAREVFSNRTDSYAGSFSAAKIVEAQLDHADVLSRLNRTDEAEEVFVATLELARTQVEYKLPKALNSFANLLARQRRYEDASARFQEGLSVVKPDHQDRVGLLYDYGRMLWNSSGPEEAEPVIAEALELQLSRSNSKRLPYTLRIMHYYGSLLSNLQRLGEAEVVLREALELRRNLLGSDHPETLDTLNMYGNTLYYLGRYDQAERVHAENLELRRKVSGNQHPKTLTAMFNYANILNDLGRSEDAEALAIEVLRHRREKYGDSDFETLRAMHLYALALQDSDRAEEAEPIMSEALRLRREVLGEEALETQGSLIAYADILLDLDRATEALPLFEQAMELTQKHEDPTGDSNRYLLTSYAEALVATGQAERGATSIETSVKSHRANLGDRHPDTINAIGLHGRILKSLGKNRDALALVREAVAAMRTRAVDLSDSGLRASAQRDRELAQRQDFDKLLVDVLWDNYNPLPVHKSGLRDEAYLALQLASAGTTSRAVAEAASLRFAAEGGLMELVRGRQDAQREWVEVEAKLLALQAQLNPSNSLRARLQAQLTEHESRVRAIDAQLAEQAPEYFAIINQEAVEVEDLLSVLEPEEAVLFLVPTENGTHQMAITGASLLWSRSGLNNEQITLKVNEIREGLEVTGGGRLPVFDFELAHELYAELIAPVESALEGKQRVYVVADGALSRLPLGVLLTEKLDAADVASGNGDAESADDPVRGTMLGGGPSTTESAANDPEDFARASWLADRYALVNLPSLQSLVFIRTFGLSDEDIEGAGYTGFGDPVLARHASQNGSRSAGLGGSVDAATMLARGSSGDALMNPASLKQMASLPGTKRELEQVSQLLGASDTSLFLGAAMTEPAIRSADLSKTRILHLATHGLTSEEGGRLGDLAEPGLVFTPPEQSSEANDGYLAASEVVGLNLTLADWVILSACNTAAPSGKAGETGLSGLAQAFFYAGAESLLVSHWPVFDSVAPILTAETLARAQQGTPRAEAFQQAMQQVRTTNPHPAAWAPFVLVGEGL